MVFKVFQMLFTSLYSYQLFVCFFEIFTYFENANWNPPQNSLLCDWSIFSSADLALAAGKMCKNELITGIYCSYSFVQDSPVAPALWSVPLWQGTDGLPPDWTADWTRAQIRGGNQVRNFLKQESGGFTPWSVLRSRSGVFWPLDPDPGKVFSGFRIQDLGSRISYPGSLMQDVRSRILDPESRITDPKPIFMRV